MNQASEQVQAFIERRPFWLAGWLEWRTGEGERLVREIVSVSAHVSLSEIDDGAVEIGRAADLNRHIFTATAADAAAAVAVREREREVVRGARARRKRCKEGKQMLHVQ